MGCDFGHTPVAMTIPTSFRRPFGHRSGGQSRVLPRRHRQHRLPWLHRLRRTPRMPVRALAARSAAKSARKPTALPSCWQILHLRGPPRAVGCKICQQARNRSQLLAELVLSPAKSPNQPGWVARLVRVLCFPLSQQYRLGAPAQRPVPSSHGTRSTRRARGNQTPRERPANGIGREPRHRPCRARITVS